MTKLKDVRVEIGWKIDYTSIDRVIEALIEARDELKANGWVDMEIRTRAGSDEYVEIFIEGKRPETEHETLTREQIEAKLREIRKEHFEQLKKEFGDT